MEDIEKRLEALRTGKAQMILSDGTAQGAGAGAWSSTQDYHPTHGVLDVTDQHIDPDQIDAELDDRYS